MLAVVRLGLYNDIDSLDLIGPQKLRLEIKPSPRSYLSKKKWVQ